MDAMPVVATSAFSPDDRAVLRQVAEQGKRLETLNRQQAEVIEQLRDELKELRAENARLKRELDRMAAGSLAAGAAAAGRVGAAPEDDDVEALQQEEAAARKKETEKEERHSRSQRGAADRPTDIDKDQAKKRGGGRDVW